MVVRCRHREDGGEEWFWNGWLHRTDGPAVSWPDGRQRWWRHGERHRSDGPAIINPDGTQSWWLHDVHMTPEITNWMTQKGVTWPWDAETQMEFELTWL